MEKIPCIKINFKEWNFIKPYLVKWNYDIKLITENFFDFPYLIINNGGEIGKCNNYSVYYNVEKYNNREFVSDVDEFLKRAAELKGYNYNRKDIVYPEDLVGDINGFPIEIVQHMVNEQVLQGNFPDVTVFQKVNYRAKDTGGFDWNLSKDGDTFWNEVITYRNFELYFKKYPKQTNMKQFTKEDLQPGMIVELRNGEKNLVVNSSEESFLISANDYHLLDIYTNDLKSRNKNFDIVKVYTHNCTGTLEFILEHDNHKLIWEREEIQEFTMGEIMQEFANKHGISVEQIRIKK